MKHTKKQLRKLANKTEVERLKEELAKKNQELYDTKLERDILKKIADPVRTLKAKQKTKIVDQIREDQSSSPKKHRYKIGDILKKIELPKATYHDEHKRIANYHDKYAKVKKVISQIAKQEQIRGRWTYGYRRVNQKLRAMGIYLSDMTVNKLMAELGIQVNLFNRHHRSLGFSS